jgi:Ca2+-transporting ATPase
VPGLSSVEAALRLRRHGPNQLPHPERRRLSRIVRDVLREPMLLLLVGAAVLYLLLGTPRDAIVLSASIVLVIALTVYQEGRSEHALQALRDFSSPRARVFRNGEPTSVPAAELVPGDLLLVAEGDRLPADARLLDGRELWVDESLLSGESVPIQRTPGSDADLLSAGTLVVRGRGRAEVIATGLQTAIGRIGADLHAGEREPTPLQLELRRVVLAFVGLSVCASALVVALQWRLLGHWLPALLAGVTLAIATIPAEFPVVLAVFLALGSWRMARHHALVRRAVAVETLGAITVLCTDKTGTLTENRMQVQELVVGGEGAAQSAARTMLLATAEQACEEHPHDPMELAFRQAAEQAGIPPREGWQRVHDYALSDALLAVAHVWRVPGAGKLRVACKGAPEAIAGLCALGPDAHAALLQDAAAMAARGLRVLAAADAEWDERDGPLPADARGFQMRLRGLLGLADPLRAGVPAAIAEAREAGVRVIMLTGDHPETARAIAAQAGLAPGDVYARVKPVQKLEMVQALRAQGELVAMTGDGVNDAPALMAADVGVAMGRRGTDVAREASDMVLLDDEFVTIVVAIRMGRAIYDNIARALRYVLAVHVPITGLALLPLLAGAPMILLPVHVVFLQMIIDPASTLVFEREPPAADVMRRPPRRAAQRLLGWRALSEGLASGALAFAVVLALWFQARAAGLQAGQVGAVCFIALVIGNLVLISLNRQSTALRALFANGAFLLVAGPALLVLAVVTAVPAPASWFGFVPPPWHWAVLAVLAPVLVLAAFASVARLARSRLR